MVDSPCFTWVMWNHGNPNVKMHSKPILLGSYQHFCWCKHHFWCSNAKQNHPGCRSITVKLSEYLSIHPSNQPNLSIYLWVNHPKTNQHSAPAVDSQPLLLRGFRLNGSWGTARRLFGPSQSNLFKNFIFIIYLFIYLFIDWFIFTTISLSIYLFIDLLFSLFVYLFISICLLHLYIFIYIYT